MLLQSTCHADRACKPLDAFGAVMRAAAAVYPAGQRRINRAVTGTGRHNAKGAEPRGSAPPVADRAQRMVTALFTLKVISVPGLITTW